MISMIKRARQEEAGSPPAQSGNPAGPATEVSGGRERPPRGHSGFDQPLRNGGSGRGEGGRGGRYSGGREGGGRGREGRGRGRGRGRF